MAKKEKVEEKPQHKVGDSILWKGIPLTVIEVFPDGSVEGWSPTMRVRVWSHEQFDKVG